MGVLFAWLYTRWGRVDAAGRGAHVLDVSRSSGTHCRRPREWLPRRAGRRLVRRRQAAAGACSGHDRTAAPPRSSRSPRTGSARSCVVAHPDDMEFGAAAAVARWTGQGKEVVYCMVTSGEAGIDGMDPDEAAGCARPSRSSRRGSSASTSSSSCGLPDGILEYGVPLRREIAAVVRRHRPEIVITGNFHDTWGGRNLNQADHIATGRAVLDAVRDAGNRWVFPEQLVDGARAVGRREAGLGRRLAAGRRTASTPPTRSTPGWRRWRPPGLHRRSRLGELRPARVPRGLRPADRPAAGVAFAAAFEVFPLGWGE